MSTYLKNKVLNHVLRNTSYSAPSSVWVGLYGSNSVELSGYGYGRVEAPSFNISASGSAINSADIIYSQASGSWGTITGFGIYDASTDGNLLFTSPISNTRYVDINDTFFIQEGNMSVTLSGAYSYYLAGELLDHILNNNAYASPGTGVYTALYTTLPDANDVGGVEVNATDYVRLQVGGTSYWSAPSVGSTANTDHLEFVTDADEDWGTIVGICLRDSATTGEILFRGNINPVATVITGDDYVFDIGWLIVKADYTASVD